MIRNGELVGLGQRENKIMHILLFIALMFLFLWGMFGIFFFDSLINNTVQKKKWIVYLIGGPLLWTGAVCYFLYCRLEDFLRKE